MDWGHTVFHSGALFPRIWGKSEFYRALEEAMLEQGRIGWEIRDFLKRLACPIF